MILLSNGPMPIATFKKQTVLLCMRSYMGTSY